MRNQSSRFALGAVFLWSGFFPALMQAQNSIPLFSPVNIRASQQGASSDSYPPVYYGTSIVNLSCPADANLSAVLSSTADGTGNVLIDNNVNITVSQGENVNGFNPCFSYDPYNTNCSSPSFDYTTEIGVDPDTLVSTYGYPAIQFADYLNPGLQQVEFDLVDDGDGVGTSTLYLNTNCTAAGVTGTGTVTGEPISATNPTPAQSTQNFTFNSSPKQLVEFVYDLSQANAAGQLTIQDQTIPQVTDQAIDPSSFTSTYLSGTSFATSSCLIHAGETLSDGVTPACKLYTLECYVGTGQNAAGAQCPVSGLPNEIFQDIFNGSSFTLPDIPTTGATFHQGIGFLMASEGWTGGPCTYDPNANMQTVDCPQNLLTSFTGSSTDVINFTGAKTSSGTGGKGGTESIKHFAPMSRKALREAVKKAGLDGMRPNAESSDSGTYTSSGRTTHPNSTFITVAPVPEDLTTVTVANQTAAPGYWINSSTASVTLLSQPPNLAGTALNNVANFVPSPIQSINYGIAAAGSVPTPGSPGVSLSTVANPTGCPDPSNLTTPTATTFTPAAQTISNLADGSYMLYYYAQDCAGTEELQFTQDVNQNWSTSFYTYPINVDTTAPSVSGITLNPQLTTGVYAANSNVTANFSCSDEGSGVANCGTQAFGGVSSTGTLTVPVSTTSTGAQTYTVNVTDVAGNTNSASVNYQVVATPVITWANPADIYVGTPLSATQLNATAAYNNVTVQGTFTYSPVLGTVLSAGTNQTLSVTFTPDDTLDFASAGASVSINVLPQPAYVVTVATDPSSGNGTASNCIPVGQQGDNSNCSLRDAIAAANALNGATPTISFSDSLFASANAAHRKAMAAHPNTFKPDTSAVPVVLTISQSTPITITQSMNITGPGTNLLMIEGGIAPYNGTTQTANHQILSISGTANVSISQVTLANGYAGSVGFGGAVANEGSGALIIADCTFSGNQANSGGAIFAANSVTVSNSTFSGNQATHQGGAILADTHATVISSTFSSNQADNLGGAIYAGVATVTNNIFTGDSAPEGSATYSSGGSATNIVYNGETFSGVTLANSINADPKLSALGNYGGTTQTFLPLPGSPAICAGVSESVNNSPITADQRGVAIPTVYGSTQCYDVGAVQTHYAISFTSSLPTTPVVPGLAMTPPPISAVSENGVPLVAGAATVGIVDADNDLSGSSTRTASTSTIAATAGQAAFTNLLFSGPEGSDTLTATLALNPSLTTPLSLTATSGSFRIALVSQKITFASLPAVTYGVAPIVLGATATSGLPVSYTVSGPAKLGGASGNVLTVTGAGTVTVTATQAGNADYAAARPIQQSFSVAQAKLTVTANPASRIYGAPNPAFTYTITGFVPNDTVSVVSGTATLASAANATSPVTTSPATTYPIVFVTEGLSAANYRFTYVPGALTITVAIQSITFNPLPNPTYGAAPITLGATASSKLPVTYQVSGPAKLGGYNNSVLTITGTGKVTVTASQAGNADYSAATPVPQSFTVNPAVLTVTANPAARVVAGVNPAFTYTVSGFVNGDKSSVVTGLATLTTTATTSSTPGTYSITFATRQLTTANYTFNYLPGTLTIAPAPPVLSIPSGSYFPGQAVAITLPSTDQPAGTRIYYTTNGTKPTTSSTLYSGPIAITSSPETIGAIAVENGISSASATANYTINSLCNIVNYANGFSSSGSNLAGLTLNNGAKLSGTALELTDGGLSEARSAFTSIEVPNSTFITNFTFQITDPIADGITFTWQTNSKSAVGGDGQALGYATMPNSEALKLDIYNDAGEGTDSTGFYRNGAIPTLPAINLSSTGINLRSGDIFAVRISYNGTVAAVTITDTATKKSYSFNTNVAVTSSAGKAYVGFTGATGSNPSIAKILTWTYSGSNTCAAN